jgi:hypothetical protein
MAIGSLINLAGSVVHSLFNANSASTSANSTPFTQILNSLEQVQQTNPAQYKAVTQQLSASLQAGAQIATASGNAVLAGQLSRLSADFTVASTTGQLPNVPDLAQAFASRPAGSPAASIIGSTLSGIGSGTGILVPGLHR